MNLIMSNSGMLHADSCYTQRGKAEPYKRFAGVDERDVVTFCLARRITPCGACLRDARQAFEALVAA